jgi:hypothetical protein
MPPGRHQASATCKITSRSADVPQGCPSFARQSSRDDLTGASHRRPCANRLSYLCVSERSGVGKRSMWREMQELQRFSVSGYPAGSKRRRFSAPHFPHDTRRSCGGVGALVQGVSVCRSRSRVSSLAARACGPDPETQHQRQQHRQRLWAWWNSRSPAVQVRTGNWPDAGAFDSRQDRRLDA